MATENYTLQHSVVANFPSFVIDPGSGLAITRPNISVGFQFTPTLEGFTPATEAWRTWNLLCTVEATFAPVEFEVWVATRWPAQTVWDSTHKPNPAEKQAQQLVAEVSSEVGSTGTGAEWAPGATWPSGATWPTGTGGGTAALSIPLNPGVMNSLRSELWAGHVFLTLYGTGRTPLARPIEFSLISATTTTEAVPLPTGWMHPPGPTWGVGRADLCPRCSMPIHRGQLVRDGYTRSEVCPSCWDPPDPFEEAPHPSRPANVGDIV